MISFKNVFVGAILNRIHGKGRTLVVLNESIVSKIFSDENKEYALNDFETLQMSADWLTELGFEKDERKDNDGDKFIVYHKNGIDIYDHSDSSGGFSYATYIKYDGSFKGGFSIPTVDQLQRLYLGLANEILTMKEKYYYIVSLKHTSKADTALTFWCANSAGYSWDKQRAGLYTHDEAVKNINEQNVMVEQSKVDIFWQDALDFNDKYVSVPNNPTVLKHLGLDAQYMKPKKNQQCRMVFINGSVK